MKKFILLLSIILLMVVPSTILVAQEQQESTTQEVDAQKEGLSYKAIAALVGAALAFGFGAMGAGAAIGRVGSAAMGAIAEKPSIAGQALIFVALAEGIVVFGFITALMILGKV